MAVGAAMVAASCALGFAVGALVPSRFSAPLVAVAVFLALGAGAIAIEHNNTYAQIWPLNVQGALHPTRLGSSSSYLPDLAITQVLFLAGLAAAVLGALGLRAAAGGRWLRCAAAVAAAAGLAAAGTGVGLAGTARLEAHGIVIPALHDTANDKPIAYTPVCSHAAVPVCLHPAYRSLLPAVTAALGPVLSEVAGLPGAPVRVSQVAFTHLQQGPHNGIEMPWPGHRRQPAGAVLPLSGMALPGEGHTTTAEFIRQLRRQVPPMILNTLFGGDQQDTNSQARQQVGAAAEPGCWHSRRSRPHWRRSPACRPTAGCRRCRPARRPMPRPSGSRRCRRRPATPGWWITWTALRAGQLTLGELP